MKNINILFLSFISLGLISCVSPSANNDSNNGSYKQKPAARNVVMSEIWFLTQINNASYQGPRITLQISDQNRISGFSGCNRYFAPVSQFSGNTIRLGAIGSTKRACADGNSNRLEHNYLNALGNVSNYQRSGNRLVLEGNGTSLTFLKKSKRR